MERATVEMKDRINSLEFRSEMRVQTGSLTLVFDNKSVKITVSADKESIFTYTPVAEVFLVNKHKNR